MISQICKKEDCTGCFACMNICPRKAISVGKDEMGCTVPIIDNQKCVDCGLCIKHCPANRSVKFRTPITCYAAQSKSNEDKYSSSGGVASVFTRNAVNSGVSVYSTLFDKNLKPIVKKIETSEDIENARSSKYVQSYTGLSFTEIKRELKNNQKVIFIGTPCQSAGLISFLNGKDENLLTVDLVCHGTPPYTYLEEYLDYIDKNQVRTDVSFRGKHDYMFTVYKEKDILYQRTQELDLYFSSFYKGLICRKNCYNCKYAQQSRVSDFTIGDFWGIERSTLNKNFGSKISMVFINSEKAKQFWRIIKDQFVYEERAIKEAVNGNPQLRYPSIMPNKRLKFEKNYVKYGFVKAIKKSWRYRILLNRILRSPGIKELRKIRYELKRRK